MEKAFIAPPLSILKRYRDFSGTPKQVNEHRVCRAIEAQGHLQVLLGTHQPNGILEIGPGIGGVTQALRAMYPFSPMTVVDYDYVRADTIGFASLEFGANLLLRDSTSFSQQELAVLLQSGGIDTVVALRTSLGVLTHLLKILSPAGFKGRMVASIILNCESDKEMSAFRQLPYDAELKPIALRIDRIMQEIAYFRSYE